MHDLVGAYALNALEADEAEAFERHLADCVKCRAELRDHRETAALLAHAGAAAPEGVWDRIAAELGDAPTDAGVVLPIGARRRRFTPTQTRRFTVVAAAAAAAVIAINSALIVQQRNDINDLRPSAAASLRSLADKAMDEPGSRVATLRHADGSVAADIVVTAQGRGYLLRPSFEALTGDRAYQLWGLSAAGRPVSLGVLGGRPTVTSFTANVALDKLAITIEKASGALTPSGAPLVSGALQRA